MGRNWGKDKQKSVNIGSGVFSSYKDKLAKKYDKKKHKLKEKLKGYKHKRKGDKTPKDDLNQDFLHIDDMSVSQSSKPKKSQSIGNENEVEYSVTESRTYTQSVMSTNALAPVLPPNLAINPEATPEAQRIDEEEEWEEEEEEKDVIEFYTLEKIVGMVTSPEVRGTQDQTVLLHTYCLYATRQFS